jgi:hypothetical protein
MRPRHCYRQGKTIHKDNNTKQNYNGVDKEPIKNFSAETYWNIIKEEKYYVKMEGG